MIKNFDPKISIEKYRSKNIDRKISIDIPSAIFGNVRQSSEKTKKKT